jgi:5-methylcytosine-specific restriction enzyme subunit McrC
MKTISVFEYQAIGTSLSNVEKTALENRRGPRGEKMFDVARRGEVKATSFVGIVQLGARTLQVLPKIHDTGLSAAKCEQQATANLLYLLSYTGKLRVTEPEISWLTEKSAPLSEILYWIFARRLWDAVRLELLRGYVSIEARLDVMKGRWLVAAQMQRSDGWRHDRFSVAYDEFTEDNLPNRLFNATVLRLSRCATLPETRRHLAQLRSVFADVARVTPQLKDFPEAARWMQRYRRRVGEGQLYRPLLEMARLFWAGAGPQPSPGQLNAFAFMFDMNQLFEEFIAEFIRCELHETWEAQGWSLRPQISTRYLLCDEGGRNVFKLVPDIRFETTTRDTDLIVDTKYKLIEAATANAGVAETDAYQMFAYKERYHCPRVVLLYPQSSETTTRDTIPRYFSADTDSPPWLEVRTVDLHRDLMREKEKMRLREELARVLVPAYNMEIKS